MNEWLAENWVLGTVIVLAALALLRRSMEGTRVPRSARLPIAVVGAHLLYAEQLFRSITSEAWEISARVDRAYRSHSGHLILVELKTRLLDETYLSDVVELSAQRYAIETSVEERVSQTAFVLVKSARFPEGRFHRVSLMPHASVRSLLARRERLLAGEQDPAFSLNPAYCRKCCFRDICPNGKR